MIDTIIYKTFVAANPDKVFQAITTSDGWNNWFTQDSSIDLREGGEMILKWHGFGPNFNTFEDKCEVLEIVPNEKFSFRWTPVDKDHPTVVTFKLFAEYGGTIVRVKDEGYPIHTEELQRIMMECACGWGEALTLLKFHIEFGVTYQHPEEQKKM